jgi:hypothetical protein
MLMIGRVPDDPFGRRLVARDLLDAARRNGGPFMIVELFNRKAPRGERVTVYPGLTGQLANVNPNTGHIVVYVEVAKVVAWAAKLLRDAPAGEEKLVPVIDLTGATASQA